MIFSLRRSFRRYYHTSKHGHQLKGAKNLKKIPAPFKSRTHSVIVGCGDVGLRILKLFGNKNRILATCRHKKQAAAIQELDGMALNGDLTNKRFSQRIANLCKSSRCFMLYAPPSQGQTDPISLKLILQINKSAHPFLKHKQRTHICYVSTIGVYGNQHGNWVSENMPTQAKTARAKRRVHAENCWRGKNKAHFSQMKGIASVRILRAPGIYARQRLPIERIKSKIPAIVSQEDAWSNHIHADDLARLCWISSFAQSGRYIINAVDDQPMKMGDYFDSIADHFGLEKPPRLPRSVVKEQVSEIMWSFMNESRRVNNQRLKKLKNFKLKFQNVETFLSQGAQDFTKQNQSFFDD
jgi:NAD dependent epimerase/dehydratase family enzyme